MRAGRRGGRCEIGSAAGSGLVERLGVGTAGAAVFATIGLAPLRTVHLTDRWLGRRPRRPGSPEVTVVDAPAGSAC
ncbi:hypothetical protein OF117_09280 [Geodermatophilus sp. YIM 151500]|uniref:hypothetical protein n=1 Tax=Geodermatophilus sp. YIM 151500 TaxID=2984531 RepID=UPI0021E4AFE0|nr:hypothetical protein [Geodermatophilus sp. YIM 151500]MCV2489560.1 hypothetical protein [Geodermatophilus sp. YIM 151500]